MAEGVEEGLEDPGADPPVAEDVETVDPRGSIETEDLSSKVSNPSDDSNIDSCDSNTQHTDDDTRNTEPMKIQSEIKTSTVPDSRVPDSYTPDNPPKVSPVLPEIISKESEDVEVYVPPIDLSSPLVEEEPLTDVTPPLFSSKSILEEEKKEAEKEVSTTEQSGTGIGFTLGAESKADILDSLAFSIKHRDSSGFMQEQFMDQDVINLADFQSGPPQQLRVGYAGPVTGWSGTDSQAGSTGKFSGRWSGAGNYEEDYGWDEGGGDNISDLLTIRRVDSKDVVYKKKKAAKFVGKYVFGDILGEGSYARVKECVDSETLCRRAVKIMKKRKLRKIPNGEENVRREIALLKSLKHKNVMQLIDVLTNEQKGKIYLVLEYCCTVLQEMLEKSVDKKFPPWQSHLYFTQLLEGLEYLHSKGIIHKDIKPGNLLLDRAEVLKIADFGVCEQIDMFSQNDLIKTSQGTPSFQPPEVATGVDLFSGEKLDIWSCGVTLYNFSTGDYPFQGDTIFKLFENIGKGEFSFHVAVDKLLEDLVTQLLALDPADRPNVKQARQHDWCRKKFPRSSQAVCAPPYLDDPFLSTTVLPYLENHHYPSSEPDLISEHDLNRQEEARLEQQQEEAAELEQERRESKTTSCIKLKNGCKQQ